MTSIGDYADNVMFVTDSREVAKEYAMRKMVGAQNFNATKSPSLYELNLLFGDDQMFDYRKSEHKALFEKLAKETGEWNKSDVMSVHPAHGSKFCGTFPSFGVARSLLQTITSYGFVACLVAEGTHGVSLAVSDPRQNIEIIDMMSLNEQNTLREFIQRIIQTTY
jgi:hypothetical protein